VELRGALGVLLILVAQHLVTVDPLGIEELLATPIWCEKYIGSEL
jgi:hypothetical protein